MRMGHFPHFHLTLKAVILLGGSVYVGKLAPCSKNDNITVFANRCTSKISSWKLILAIAFCFRWYPAAGCLFHTSAVSGARPKSPLPTARKEMIYHSKVRGIDILRDPKLNKVNKNKTAVMFCCLITKSP